ALLKEIAPHTMRAAVLRDPAVPAGIGQFAVIQSVAGSVGVEAIPINLGDTAELERELADFAQSENGGLVITAGALSAVNRNLIITLAARHKLPAVYQERNYKRMEIGAATRVALQPRRTRALPPSSADTERLGRGRSVHRSSRARARMLNRRRLTGGTCRGGVVAWRVPIRGARGSRFDN